MAAGPLRRHGRPRSPSTSGSASGPQGSGGQGLRSSGGESKWGPLQAATVITATQQPGGRERAVIGERLRRVPSRVEPGDLRRRAVPGKEQRAVRRAGGEGRQSERGGTEVVALWAAVAASARASPVDLGVVLRTIGWVWVDGVSWCDGMS